MTMFPCPSSDTPTHGVEGGRWRQSLLGRLQRVVLPVKRDRSPDNPKVPCTVNVWWIAVAVDARVKLSSIHERRPLCQFFPRQTRPYLRIVINTHSKIKISPGTRWHVGGQGQVNICVRKEQAQHEQDTTVKNKHIWRCCAVCIDHVRSRWFRPAPRILSVVELKPLGDPLAPRVGPGPDGGRRGTNGAGAPPLSPYNICAYIPLFTPPECPFLAVAWGSSFFGKGGGLS